MTVLTLTGLSLEAVVKCDACEISQASIVDQLERCYCNDCADELPCCEECTEVHSSLYDGQKLVLYKSWVCSECIDELYSPCDDCDRLSLSRELTKTEEDCEYVCQTCLDNKYVQCDNCSKVILNDNTCCAPNEDSYCQDCGDEYIAHCTGCGDTVWVENCEQDDDGYSYCECCYRDRCSSDISNPDDWCDHVHPYSHDVRADLGLLGRPKNRIFYGVELEVVVDGDRDDFRDAAHDTSKMLKDFALLKADSSIDPGGFEIVTTAAEFDLHYKYWQPFFDHFPGCLEVNSTVGMHVHISKKRLTKLHIGKILVFLNEECNRPLCQAIAGRKHCNYAKYKDKKFGHAKECSSDRYEVVAIRSKTLEFRLFAATLSSDVFFARLEFAKALVTFTRNASCRNLNQLNFVEFVLTQRREYKYLYKHLQALQLAGFQIFQ